MITIGGLSPLQKDIADRLWALDSTEAVEQYIQTLPRSLKREAWVVLQMIIAGELDSYMEVSDEVGAYLRSR